jgi:hypothetical protein
VPLLVFGCFASLPCQDAQDFINIRDAINPGMKIDADELGVILPDDNDPKYTSDEPGFPLIYWNAAGASRRLPHHTASAPFTARRG